MEKVYCINDYWDSTITQGISKYSNENYFFECIFSKEDDNWSNNYYLTLLDENIFELSLENWEYWKNWLKQSIIPHPVEYANKRKIDTMENIFLDINVDSGKMESTEKYYQNEILIKQYLKNNKPKYIAKGSFYGKNDMLFKMANGEDSIEVLWEDIQIINQ